MLKRWKIVLVVACVGLIVGLAFWLPGYLNDPTRVLVGEWDVESTPQRFEGKWQGERGQGFEDLKNLPEEATKALEPKLRSAERLTFRQNGEFSTVQRLLGLTITTEGTWKARRGEADQVVVTMHKRKTTVQDPNGETEDKEQDRLSEWVVSRSGGGELNVSVPEPEKGARQFKLRRAEN
jgi:hypothetical protein